MKARRGIYAAAVSPFLGDGTLDRPGLVRYCQYLLSDGGCDGVAPTGTTGEGTSIALDDRLQLPQAFAKAAIAPDRVIFGTGTPALGDTIRLCSNALDCGYQNVLVLPPYYYKNVTDDGLFAFYARLIEGVGNNDLRIFLYHFPQMSTTPLSPDLLVRLRAEFGPIIAGVKDSSGDFENSRSFVDATGGVAEDFDVYPSSEAMLFDALAAGCAGIISGSTNAFAGLVQAARAAGSADSPEFEKVCSAREFAGQFNLMAAMKYAEYLRTGDKVWLNLMPPLAPLTDGAAEAFATGLAGFRSDK